MIYWRGKAYEKAILQEFLHNQLNENPEEWERRILEFALEWLDENRQFFEVKTSGSTGAPKLIQLSRTQMTESALATQRYLNLKKGDSALLVLPAEFIAGKMMIVRAFVLGLDLYYLPPQIAVLENLARPYDFTAVIPLQLQHILDSGQQEKLQYLEKTIIGGAALSNHYISDLRKSKKQYWATYGMTETITHIAMKSLSRDESVYEALPGISFSQDAEGCLIIHSERLPEKQTHTTDLVNLISDFSFEYKGRKDHMINSGALKIIPEEIEEIAQKALEQEVFAGYQLDEKLGQKVVLVLQFGELDKSEILRRLAVELPKNRLPKEVLFIKDFIKTENHKIKRSAMQNWIFNNS
jgi:O-succinylbenzoic acid--CoA ligase